MRKFYSEPTMDVSVFDVENIVTESIGVATDADSIDDGVYAKVQIGYNEFNIVF